MKNRPSISNRGSLQQSGYVQPSIYPGVSSWMNHFLSEMDDFFGEDINGFNTPAINVREEEDAVIVDLAAPGMKKEDFRIEVDKGVLSISAESKDEREEKDDRYMRREFNYRNFRRSFWLSDQIDQDKIEAHYDQGLLVLRIPKVSKAAKSKEQAKTINIV